MTKALSLLSGLLWLLLSHLSLFAQLPNPYILNGTATKRTCNCYVLTGETANASGTVWNKYKINLNNSFDYYFDINLGCNDETGADGMAFILQTQGTNIGNTGQGMGFQRIRPSLGVLIDTWQNPDDDDPEYDHISINMNGDISHNSPYNLAGPVTALNGSDNIEDCNWHILRIRWDAVTQLLEVSIDGALRVSVQKDLVADIFRGDPMVYWGFGAATGGNFNKHEFCAALHPQLKFNDTQSFCDGTPIVFADDSKSFGTITSWLWDFGDGTSSSLPNPPPHVYAKAGEYEVSLAIKDNAGCTSTNKDTVNVFPAPRVSASGGNACIGQPLSLTGVDQTPAIPLSGWYWDFGNGQQQNGQQTSYIYPEGGAYQAALHAVSTNGCFSDTFFVPVNIVDIDLFAGNDTAIVRGQPLQLNAQATGNDLQFTWSPATGLTDVNSADPIAHLQQDQVYYLTVTSSEGCIKKDTLYVKVHVAPEPSTGPSYVPTAFSPNSDGRNDIFRTNLPDISKFDFLCIWTRWGQEIFRTQSLSAGWDGRFQGSPVPAGAYVWMIQGTDNAGRLVNRKGTITVVR